MNILDIAGKLKYTAIGKSILREKISKTDMGILKVAFMVSALDGDITDDEFEAFSLMAKKCRGYTEEAEDKAMRDAMRAAGYLMLLSKRVKETELVKAFIKEANAALPNGFAYYSIDDIRRAIVTWIAMGMSDGDYSTRERKCIEALRKNFAEMKVSRIERENERLREFSPAFFQARNTMGINTDKIEIISKDYVDSVEETISKLGDTKSAEKALKDLISSKQK